MDEKLNVTEEVAISYVKEFAEYHRDKTISIEKVKEDYPDVIEAVMLGLLTFDEDQTPRYTLKRPLKGEGSSVLKATVEFKTRIPVRDLERITKGINPEKEAVKFGNVMRAYIIKEPIEIFDKFGKFDTRVIDQVSSVFQ